MALQLNNGEAAKEFDRNDKIRQLLGHDLEHMVPSIVVVGNQSTGKSSLLERLSGLQLPQGDGTVTRMPVALRMRQPSESDTSENVTMEFDGRTEAIDPGTVADRIREITAKECPDGGFSDKEITFVVRRYGVPPVTLIDLPGIKYDSDDGDIVKKLIEKRIKSPNTTILVVHNAQVESSNSEAFKLASQADEHGTRTIVAVTYLDLLVKTGKFAPTLKLLKEKEHTAVGVGQFIEKNISDHSHGAFAELNRTEMAAIRSTVEFNGLSNLGFEALATLLNAKYLESIRSNRYHLGHDLREKWNELAQELDSLPEAVSSDQLLRDFFAFSSKKYAAAFTISGDPSDQFSISPLIEALGNFGVIWKKCTKSLFNNDKFIAQVVKTVKEDRSCGLPDLKHPLYLQLLFRNVLLEIKARFLETCLPLIKKHFDSHHAALDKAIRAKWGGTHDWVFKDAREYVSGVALKGLFNQLVSRVESIACDNFDLEMETLMTFNDHYYTTKKNTIAEALQPAKAPLGKPGLGSSSKPDSNGEAAMRANSRISHVRPEVDAALASKCMEYVISLLAYGTVVRKRFVDNFALQVMQAAKALIEDIEDRHRLVADPGALFPNLNRAKEKRADLEDKIGRIGEALRQIGEQAPNLHRKKKSSLRSEATAEYRSFLAGSRDADSYDII